MSPALPLRGFCAIQGAIRSAPAFLRHDFPGARSVVHCVVERGQVELGDEVWIDGVSARIVTIGLPLETGHRIVPGMHIRLVVDVDPEVIKPGPGQFLRVFTRDGCR